MTMNKLPPAALPVLKNAGAAPIVFFDGAPMFGVLNGIIEVEVAAQILTVKAGGQVVGDWTCCAHLRCSPAAAQSLRAALDQALALINTPPLDTAKH
jgi:hypothetical protein